MSIFRRKADVFKGIDYVEGTEKKIGINTWRYLAGPSHVYGKRWVIRYHLTDIAVFDLMDGSLMLDSGGWMTVTTKERMNRILNGEFAFNDVLDHEVFHSMDMSLYQQNSEWFINRDGETIPYRDGITLKKNHPLPEQTAANVEKRNERKALLKKIDAYCRAVNKLDELPKPDNGDCWYCCMKEVKTGKPLGEMVNDSDHLISHLDEKYIHGSIIMNAMRYVGYQDAAIYLAYHRGSDQYWRHSVSRALRKYFKRQLGLPA